VSRVPQITPIAVSNADKQYLALQELLVQNILTAHRVTSPMLMGIKNNTGLGNNADELNQAFEVYLNTVVQPYQEKILKCIGKVLKINKINIPIEIIQNKPITTQFNVEDMKAVMTQDEIREEIGLPPLESNEQVEEDEFTNMSSNQSLLDWIEKYGEDTPNEDWELLSDEIVTDEAEEFDYEGELNKLHKVEFAMKPSGAAITTDSGIDERDESQDGIDREHNLYKVRYRYSTAISRTNSRQFCVNMLLNNRIYRKDHIIKMNSESFNPGFGGGSSYSIWLYKGGPQCGHYWRREIYFYKLGEAKGEDISDATKIITTTEARSKGFYPKPNESEVSRAPRNMPNNGYKNPR